MNTLNIGSTYCIKFPNSTLLLTCKLVAKYETILPHQLLYTFTDNSGNKISITNRLFNKINISEKIELPHLSLAFQRYDIIDDLYN